MEAQSRLVDGYSWKHGQLMADTTVDAVKTLHVKLVLAENISKLRKSRRFRLG